MPHKRAKRSVRAAQQVEKGRDLAPTDTHSGKDISKRAAWVLGAEKVRREFREKRRRGKDDVGEDDTGRMSIKKRRKATEDNLPHTILPGESLGHFNKRIETDFRPSVRAAVRSSAKIKRLQKASGDNEAISSASPAARKTRTSYSDAETQPSTGPQRAGDPRARKTEFEPRPVRTRLNDIAVAPPTLRRATRKAPAKSSGSASVLGLSMAQKAAMEAERESAIRRYREVKEAKRIEAEEQKQK